MTPLEAIGRLQNRSMYLADKVAQMVVEGRSTFWFEKDIEACALAIEALEYLQAVRDYEASQSQAPGV